jgi:hypothetical protein
MGTAAKLMRENRTIIVAFQYETTYVRLLDDGKAFRALVMAVILSCGFQLKHTATWRGGGGLTRPSPYVRVRLGGLTIWHIPCTTCRAVFTVRPHCVLHYRQMRPEVARAALLAMHGGCSLERCAVLYHRSPMALYRLVCAFGQRIESLWDSSGPTRGSGALRRWEPVTPAMAARLTDHVWTTTELLSYRVPPHCLDTLPDLERLYPPFEETHHGS